MRYEKGRKDQSRGRIVEVAAKKFREDGIAATGLAAVMGDAGLTNGAFYVHFGSKADLVRDSMAAALDQQLDQIRRALDEGGPAALIDLYLSPAHRDHPGLGCASAALLPELARQPSTTRDLYAERVHAIAQDVAAALPPDVPDPQAAAIAAFACLIGTLQLARTLTGTPMSDDVLAAGRSAARKLLGI